MRLFLTFFRRPRCGFAALLLFSTLVAGGPATAQTLTFSQDGYASYAGARAIAAADFNRDGWIDLAQANTGRNTVTVLLSTAGTGFLRASDIGVGAGPFAMTTADFNRDGVADLAVANADGDSISLLFGRGNGTFTRRDITATGSPRGITSADVNGDGIVDLIYTGYMGNKVAVLANDGTGQFRYQTSVVGYFQHPQGIVAADFNRDGQIDLAVAYDSVGGLGIFYLANGLITTNVAFVLAEPNLNVLSAADLNGDGWLDVAAAATNRARVAVYVGGATGPVYRRGYSTDPWPAGISIADLNQDGAPDLVTANRTANTVSVLAGDLAHPGGFLPAVDFAAGQGSRAVAVADFNTDGRLDLATGNQYDTDTTVLWNGTSHPRAAYTFHRQSLGTAAPSNVAENVWPADFDRDGRMDVAVQGPGAYDISVLRTTKGTVTIRGGADRLVRFAPGDFNGDGNLDIVALLDTVSGDFDGRILMYTNDATAIANGGLEFTAAAPVWSPLWTSALAVADLTRDGRDEVIVSGYDKYERVVVIEVHARSTDGTLTRLSRTVIDGADLNQNVHSLAVADVNRDGTLDVLAQIGGQRIDMWSGDDRGGLTYATTVYTGEGGIDIDVADLNHDGLLDLVQVSSNHVIVALGTGSAFGAPASFDLEADWRHTGFATGDLDLDGHTDLVTGNGVMFRGRGDGTFEPFERFDFEGAGVKVVDFNRDGLPDIVVQKGGAFAEVIVNEFNDVNHPPVVTFPTYTFTYADVIDECPQVWVEATDPDVHALDVIWRDETGAVLTTAEQQSRMGCGNDRQYGTARFQATVSDGRGASVTGTMTVTIVPAKEVVVHTHYDDVTSGAWTPWGDATAADSIKAYDPNAGAPKVSSPLANPGGYYELQFLADPTQAYKLWLRLKGDNNSWANDSVWVQFSGSTDTAGTPKYRIGTTSGLSVSLEECVGCGVSGWGWEDDGWGALNRNGVLLRFPEGGRQTIRFQTREDGVSVDQVVLSAEKYLTTRPGAAKNDNTILAATPR